MLQVWVWRPSESEDSSEADCQSLTSSESEVKKLKSVKIGCLKTQDCRRNINMEQRLFQRNLMALNAYPLKSAGKWHSTHSTATAVSTGYISKQGMDFKLFPPRTLTKSRNRSLVIWSSFNNDSLMRWQPLNVSFTPLYKGVKTWRLYETQQRFESVETLLKLLCIINLEFLINFHILEILESYLICIVNTTDSI